MKIFFSNHHVCNGFQDRKMLFFFSLHLYSLFPSFMLKIERSAVGLLMWKIGSTPVCWNIEALHIAGIAWKTRVTGLQDSRWYLLRMQRKQKCATPQTYNDYLLDVFTFHSFYLSRECNLIFIAENFVVLLVRQYTVHTLSYFCK
jgi:hypothetical protein